MGTLPPYYKLFKISQTATQVEIKRAYRKLANEWHPDKSNHPDAKERFQLIQEVYQTLSDSKLRAEYDARHSTRSSSSGSTRGSRSSGTSSKPSRYVRFTLHELFRGAGQDAITGKEYTFGKGTLVFGNVLGMPDGTSALLSRDYANDRYTKFAVIDDRGTLKVEVRISAWEAMVRCKYKLRHPNGNIYSATIPSGIQNGQNIRLTGMGLNGADLLINVEIYIPSLTASMKKRILKLLNKTTVEI